MKATKIIGIIWLIFGIGLIYIGFNDLFKYSTPHILWFFMLTVEQVYSEIIYGIFFSMIGINYIYNRPKRYYVILLISFAIFTNIFVNFIKYENYISIDALLFIFLISVSMFNLYKNKDIKYIKKYLSKNKVTVSIILLFGIFPSLLGVIAPYSFYKFLH